MSTKIGYYSQFKQWISEFLGLYKSDSAEAEALRKAADDIDALIKMWDDMLKKSLTANKALETAKARENKNSAEKDGVVQYSDKSFAEQVDDVLAGTFDRTNAVYVGKTPKILQDVGLNGNLPMLTTARHLRDANKPKNDKKHHHGLTKEQLKLIPQKIAEPAMILDSLDVNSNSIVVVTDMIDKDNCPIIVIISADGKGTYNNVVVDSNFVKSYYGRNGFVSFVENNVSADNFLYINKKRSQKLSNSAKVQFLGKLNNYDFDIIIRQTRANVNDKTVNNDDVQFADKDSDESKSIKEQLNSNKSKLEKIEPVASINTSKTFGNARDAYDWAIQQLKQSGYKTDRLGFGTVVFDEKRLKNGLRYLKTDDEYIAYSLIPKVIKRGIIIGEHSNHKDRGYHTTTIAAPIEINNTRGNMAVVIRSEGKNYYKLHRVFMPDGSVFAYKKENTAERAAATINVVDTPTDDVSKKSVPDFTEKNNVQNVNIDDLQKSDKATETDTDLLRSLLDEEELRSLKEREVIYQNKIKRLSEQLKAEKKKSKGKIYEHNLSGTAAHLLEHYGSEYKKSELVKDLDELYDRMVALPETVKDFAYGIASKVYDGITAKKTVDENAASLLAELKTRRSINTNLILITVYLTYLLKNLLCCDKIYVTFCIKGRISYEKHDQLFICAA